MATRMAALVTGLAVLLAVDRSQAADADLILHHGKIVTVDPKFSIREGLAIKDGRILRVGTSEEVLQTRGPRTKLLDLAGKSVLPGLIDSHVHPAGACMTEFDHPVPELESIADVLAYIRSRAKSLAAGEWDEVQQVFMTRMREPRYPSPEELDAAASK